VALLTTTTNPTSWTYPENRVKETLKQ